MHLHIDTESQGDGLLSGCYQSHVTMLKGQSAIPSGQVSMRGGAGQRDPVTLAPEHFVHAAQQTGMVTFANPFRCKVGCMHGGRYS